MGSSTDARVYATKQDWSVVQTFVDLPKHVRPPPPGSPPGRHSHPSPISSQRVWHVSSLCPWRTLRCNAAARASCAPWRAASCPLHVTLDRVFRAEGRIDVRCAPLQGANAVRFGEYAKALYVGCADHNLRTYAAPAAEVAMETETAA